MTVRGASKTAEMAGLVAVDVVGQPAESHRPLTMEVALTSGVVIRLREDVSTETLQRVLTATHHYEHSADDAVNANVNRRGASC